MSDQSQYDPNTGEAKQSNVPWYKSAPDISQAKTFTEIAGPRPAYLNLRDHPEMNNKKIIVTEVRFSSGEFGDFAFMGCYILDEDNVPVKPVVIMTGSEDVYARVLICEPLIKSGTPMVGTLRQVGRAWILD